MAEITMPQDVRTMTFEISEETRINFMANYNSVAIRCENDVGISEFSGKMIGDNGVLKCNAGESVLYPNLITKKYIYLIGTGKVEILVGNDLSVNPFKNGGKGGGGTQKFLTYLGVTTTQIIDGSTINPIIINGEEITAKEADWVIYQSKDFIFNGTAWQEVGDLSNYYTKSETDNLLSNKANTNDVYNKTQSDDLFLNKNDFEFVSAPTATQITNSINTIWGD